MLLEIKAEILALMLDSTFVRNLSVIFIVAIASLCGLSELHSQNRDISQQTSINGIYRSHLTKIVIERRW